MLAIPFETVPSLATLLCNYISCSLATQGTKIQAVMKILSWCTVRDHMGVGTGPVGPAAAGPIFHQSMTL